jgi:hypothetical protein
MNTAATSLDYVAAIIVLLIFVVSMLTLFGMGILMAVGAVFSHRPLVTSWPADQEHSFSTFERRGAVANSQAWVLSFIGAVLLTVFATGVYFGVAPDKRDISKDMNMSNLTKKRTPAAPKPDATAPAEAPAKPEAPAPEAPKQ